LLYSGVQDCRHLSLQLLLPSLNHQSNKQLIFAIFALTVLSKMLKLSEAI
jgi:hypothetical protein